MMRRSRGDNARTVSRNIISLIQLSSLVLSRSWSMTEKLSSPSEKTGSYKLVGATADSSAMATFSGEAPTWAAISDIFGSRPSRICSSSRACIEW